MPMESGAAPDRGGYVLGHDERELRRLGTQARLIDPITRRFLLASGLAPGMRVLDVGSGAGDVAFLAAGIVGPSGSVIGIDRSVDAIATAGEAAAARGLANVRFLPGDLGALTLADRFDAVIGRYILQWLPDPAGTLRTLARQLEPGGVMLFHEVDWGASSSFPTAALFDETCRWVAQTISRSGAEIRGKTLFGTFKRAGLGSPMMRLEAVVGGGPDAEPIDLVADLALTVAPAAETYGIASIGELDLNTLHTRLRAEAAASDAVLVARAEVGAWVRRPSERAARERGR